MLMIAVMQSARVRAETGTRSVGYPQEALRGDATIIAGGNEELGDLTAGYLQGIRNGEGRAGSLCWLR